MHHEADELRGPDQRASGGGDDLDMLSLLLLLFLLGDDLDMCEGRRGGRGRRRGQPAQDPKGQTDRAGQDAGGRHEQSERNAVFL